MIAALLYTFTHPLSVTLTYALQVVPSTGVALVYDGAEQVFDGAEPVVVEV